MSYGADKKIPMLIGDGFDEDLGADWIVTMEIKSSSGTSYYDAYHCIHNAEEYYLVNGPYHILMDFGGTWDSLGMWTITDIELTALDDMIRVTFDELSQIGDIEVLNTPGVTTTVSASPNSIGDGELVDMTLSITNAGTVDCEMACRFYIDENLDGQYNSGEAKFHDSGDPSFNVGDVYEQDLQENIYYVDSNSGIARLSLDGILYGDNIDDITFHDTFDITVAESDVQTHTLTIETTGEGSVRVIPPDEITTGKTYTFNYGETISLYAIDNGWYFSGWQGDLIETISPVTISLTSNMTITATFTQSVNPDFDGDTVLNDEDNCPYSPNFDQLDSDEDGIGNVCDPTPFPDNDTPGFTALIFLIALFSIVMMVYVKRR